MAKKKKSKTSSNDKNVDTKERIVTMQALQEQSDDDNDDNGLPPESEWNADAKALKARIDEGQFDQLVLKLENKKQNKKDDEEESSIEEVDLEDEDSASSAEESRENEEMAEPHEHEAESEDEIEKDSDMEKEDVAFDNEEEEQDDEGAQDAEEESGNEGNDSADEIENEVDDDDESENETSGDDKNTHHAKNKENRSKALHIVTEMLVAEKKKWPWAETFDVVVETPLPFGTGENDVNIHDDLKRELAFYDMALEAVHVAKRKCKEANIPFTRPDDFFAEMVKTDDHMAKVKDRLIFENKKMEAVAQRKASKEQKLRAKESQAQKQAEKSKKKKEHFRAVEEWAETAANNRGRRLPDKDDGAAFFQQRTNPTKSKKRQYYDQKYGFGGKRGRFKQNDPKTLNDPSGFNRNGNFGGMGTKLTKKTGSGSNRPGKRARDASRKRSR